MNVPKLRFKEFSDSWEEKKFDEVFSFLQNNTFSRECLTNEVQEVQNIHYGDILVKYNNILEITNQIPYIKKENDLNKFNSESYLKTGDIVIADTAEDFTVGKTIEIKNIENKKVLAGLHTFACRTNFNFSFGYLGQYMNSNQYHSQLYSLVTGIKVSSISKQSIKDTKIKYPFSLQEQEKIGNFLSNIDKKIALTEEKLNLFKDYKKGMMQKIFSQKLRFKDENRNEFPDWEEKRLGDITNIIMGQSPNSCNYNEDFQGLPLIQGNADCNNREILPRMYTTEITKESFPNDIIMTVRAPVGAISLSQIHSCIGRGVCAIRNGNKYIYHYLIKLENSWDKIAQGSTFTAINSNDIKNLIINLPCLEEQEKIANFLTSIDNKIENISNDLENLKEFKKGLLQKMFI